MDTPGDEFDRAWNKKYTELVSKITNDFAIIGGQILKLKKVITNYWMPGMMRIPNLQCCKL